MLELTHIEATRQRLRDRDQARAERYRVLWAQAESDSRAIVDMIAREYHPTRVYQWGSVLRPERFRDYSDIDIAVEGVLDAETFFHMLGAAQAMTEFDLHLVQIEKTVPEYAEEIREYGKVAYERRRHGQD